MDFSLGFLTSDQSLIKKDFNSNGDLKSTTLSRDQFSDFHFQGVFLSPEVQAPSEIEFLDKDQKFFPIRISKDFEFTSSEEFESVEYEEIKPSFLKLRNQWVLSNNLGLMEEIFTIADHLRKLWPNDRNTFFQELWFVLWRNLGAQKLKIIYNSLEKNEAGKKNLVQIKIHGEKLPESEPGGEPERVIMEHYKGLFAPEFAVQEFNQDNGKLVATTSIMNSPILIMAHTYGFTKFQETALKSLFNGLQIPIQ